jgi:hypothetical protein
MGNRVLAVGIVGSLSLAVVVACGASGSSDDGSSSGGTSSGASGTLGSSGAGDDGGGDLGGCGYESHTAQPTPLDLVFLLDASGSMNEAPGGGATKWQTVKAAIASFAGDPKSAGLGAGLVIFPVRHAGAPASCTSSTQCNTGGTNYGKCTLHACHQQNRNDPYVFCDTANDCPGMVPCREFGACSDPVTNAPSQYCEPDDPQGSTCDKADDNCLPYAAGLCSLDECFASDYVTPKAPIAPLPGTFASTVNALPDPDVNNATPTSMAIKSGLDLATAYGKANAGHALAIVLATDGLPTRCDPQDIPGLAALVAGGLTGTPSVKTFVVGVFTPTEATQAQANLDALASAGGSSKSFIVNAAGNLGADFQAALATVRGQALPCEYTIPPPSGGGAQDFGKVNVEYTSGSGMKNVLGYKTSMAMCGADGGWYYDVDPSNGMPTKIFVCPATCDTLKADTGAAKLDILLGCKTVIK